MRGRKGGSQRTGQWGAKAMGMRLWIPGAVLAALLGLDLISAKAG
jgi:hypothetical protein